MSNHASRIKSMKLYTHIERVHNELAEIGKDNKSKLDAAEISAFDQLHYHGTKAVDHALDLIQPDSGARFLEIGSGFGGPARHIAVRTGARVTALELQPDQNALAAELTERCGLSNLVSHACGDFLDYDWNRESFNAIVSWLAIFHIPDRPKLLDISRRILDDNGLFFTEDMYCRRPMEEREREELANGMYAAYLPDLVTYRRDFTDSGFEILHCEDMSDDWTRFTTDRLNDYRDERERHIRVHDEATYNAMEEFYDLVNRHFRSGKLGGVRLLARVKAV